MVAKRSACKVQNGAMLQTETLQVVHEDSLQSLQLLRLLLCMIHRRSSRPQPAKSIAFVWPVVWSSAQMSSQAFAQRKEHTLDAGHPLLTLHTRFAKPWFCSSCCRTQPYIMAMQGRLSASD